MNDGPVLNTSKPSWQSRSLDGPAGSLNILSSGNSDATVMLLLPALGRDSRDFDQLAQALQADFHLVRLDWRGSGCNSDLAPSSLLEDYLADCLAVMEVVSPDQPLWILGATFGNRVARLLASRHPSRCAALVLLAAGGAVPPSPQATAAARAFMGRLLSGPEQITTQQAALYFGREDFFERPQASQINFSEFLAGWWPQCLTAQRAAARSFVAANDADGGNLSPTLILQGLQDQLAPPENGRRLAATLPLPSRLIEIPEAGHLLALERPEPLARAILDFQKELMSFEE